MIVVIIRWTAQLTLFDLHSYVGRLALKLVKEEVSSKKHRSSIIILVYQFTLFYCKPFQAIASVHHLGYQAGMQNGTVIHATLNIYFCHQMNYITGQDLSTVQSNMKSFVIHQLNTNNKKFIAPPALLHYHALALREGLHVLDSRVDDVPTDLDMANEKSAHDIMAGKIYSLTRVFMFREFGSGNLLDLVNISESIDDEKSMIRPLFAIGIFYEGLVCFMQSFQVADSSQRATWTKRGQAILARMKCWCEYSTWNWENKVLILEAMKMDILSNRDGDSAGLLYNSAIRSAHEHKFVHEEAIASELMGDFSFEQCRQSEAYALYMHSIKCFREWGAQAIATRIESSLKSKFALRLSHLEKEVDVGDIMKDILEGSTDVTTKRGIDEFLFSSQSLEQMKMTCESY